MVYLGENELLDLADQDVELVQYNAAAEAVQIRCRGDLSWVPAAWLEASSAFLAEVYIANPYGKGEEKFLAANLTDPQRPLITCVTKASKRVSDSAGVYPELVWNIQWDVTPPRAM